MSIKAKKKRHIILIILAIVFAGVAVGTLILMTHTQILVGMIQKM